MPSQAKPSQANNPKSILKSDEVIKPVKRAESKKTVTFAADLNPQNTLPQIKEQSTLSSSGQSMIDAIAKLKEIYPRISNKTNAVNKYDFQSFIKNFNILINSEDFSKDIRRTQDFKAWENFLNNNLVATDKEQKILMSRLFGIDHDKEILPIVEKLKKLEFEETSNTLPKITNSQTSSDPQIHRTRRKP